MLRLRISSKWPPEMHGYVQCLALLTRICKSVRTKQNLRITVIQSNDIADIGLIIDCVLIGPYDATPTSTTSRFHST